MATVTYQNGYVPDSAMSTFMGKKGLTQFINQLNAFVVECRANGINITVGSGQDIFRDIAGQKYWKAYWTRQGKPGNAAAVGTSNHGLAIAADISGMGNWGTTTHKTCERIAAKHNLRFTVASESWHIEATNFAVGAGRRSITVNTSSQSGGASGNRYFPTKAAFAAVQGGYKAIGYDLGPYGQDGVDGPRMKAIVSDFQRKQGLPVDGVHGPATEKKLIAAQPKPSTPAPAPATGLLKKGSKGQAVEVLQRTLNAKYPAYSKLRVDGDFGAGTDKVVREFQRRAKLRVDGVVGPAVRKALGI